MPTALEQALLNHVDSQEQLITEQKEVIKSQKELIELQQENLSKETLDISESDEKIIISYQGNIVLETAKTRTIN